MSQNLTCALTCRLCRYQCSNIFQLQEKMVRTTFYLVVPLDMKGCICHLTKWQIHSFISKGLCVSYTVSRILADYYLSQILWICLGGSIFENKKARVILPKIYTTTEYADKFHKRNYVSTKKQMKQDRQLLSNSINQIESTLRIWRLLYISNLEDDQMMGPYICFTWLMQSLYAIHYFKISRGINEHSIVAGAVNMVE